MKYQPTGQLTAAILTLLISGAGLYGSAALIGRLGPDPYKELAATQITLRKHVSLPQPLIAKAAVLYDPTTNTVLYQKDAMEPLPLASLTKLITAHTALSLYSPDTKITITKEELLSHDGLHAGDTLTLRQLLRLGLIISSNSAMAAVAHSLGSSSIETINTHASQLNLSHTIVYDPAGLDVSTTTAGAYGSAYDMAQLAAAFYHDHPEYFELTLNDSVVVPLEGHTAGGIATAAPLLSIPGLIGAKTGFTDLAGGNLVAVFDLDLGHPLVAVVLGSTEDGRFDDIKTLIAGARSSL